MSRSILVIASYLAVSLGSAWAQPAAAPADTIKSGKLAEGTRWETPWYEVNSGEEGPVLFVTGGVHGNEPAGSRAAEQIRDWKIVRGKMIVVPQLNRLGLAANIRWMPAYRNDKRLRDANRNFPTKDGDNEARTELCQALWAFVQQHKPDWVVDLHEGFDFHIANTRSVGSSLIYLGNPEVNALAVKMQSAANATVEDPQRRFVLLNKSGPAKGSFARACAEQMNARSFILETTFRDQPLALRVRQHHAMMTVLMRDLGMLPPRGEQEPSNDRERTEANGKRQPVPAQ